MPVVDLVQRCGLSGQLSVPLPASTPPAWRDALALELMRWWKEYFFKWTNSPACEACGAVTAACGSAAPNVDERQCPGKLLETRRGRCGEWANCFGLVCCALGLEVRYVIDWTDHVWVELWCPARSRWVHADACEGPGAFDTPLMYEAGWGKKLSFIIAVGEDRLPASRCGPTVHVRSARRAFTRTTPKMGSITSQL